MGKKLLIEKVAILYLLSMLLVIIFASLYFPVWGWGLSLLSEYSWPVGAGFILVS